MVKNPLLNEDYCYHSIRGDVFRMESILKHGILSFGNLSVTGMPQHTPVENPTSCFLHPKTKKTF
jgi:hypothetical protein